MPITRFVAIACLPLLMVPLSLHAAGITDKAQLKEWYYLQHLATDLYELDHCISAKYGSMSAVDRKTAFKKQADLSGDYADEVEQYATNYAQTRADYESPSAFRYRIWQFLFQISQDDGKKAFDPDVCFLSLDPKYAPH